MVIGVLVYLSFRRRQGLSLRETVKVQSLEPLGVEEVEYQSVLVAFEDDSFSEEMVATAKALAARKRPRDPRAGADVVPTQPAARCRARRRGGEAQTKIEQAKLMCGQRVTGSDRAGASRRGGGRRSSKRPGRSVRRRS